MKSLTILILIQLFTSNVVFAIEQNFTSYDSESNNLQNHINILKTETNLVLPLDEEIEMLKQLYSFDLGKFLLSYRKLNGYWRSYLIIEAPKKKLTNDLENWYINKSPRTLATRERFYIFQDQTKSFVEVNKLRPLKIASIPCGMMDDLLTIDYGDTPNLQLVGVDTNLSLLKLVETNAQAHTKQNVVRLLQGDIWDLKISQEFDLVVHHGGTLYLQDENKIIELYRCLYKSLKQGGILITSFLTPAPYESIHSPWKNFNPDDVKKEKALHKDLVKNILKSHTEQEIRNYLELAGFKIIRIIYDSRNIFPTIVAQRI